MNNNSMLKMAPKYPRAKVTLTGNLFPELNQAISELRRVGASEAEIDQFIDKAIGGSYDMFVIVCNFYMWVDQQVTLS